MDEQMQELEQEGEVRQGPEDGREAQAETPPGREAEEAGELFPLKYMDGIHRVSREEMTALAQKGMDYDRIRAQRDQLRRMQSQWEAQGARPEERAPARTRPPRGGTPDGAGQGTALPGSPRGEDAGGQARRREIQAFLEAFPNVTGEQIPQEVWRQVRGGTPLPLAYSLYENRRLTNELSALRQNQRNSRTAVGGPGRGGTGTGDLLSRWWSED